MPDLDEEYLLRMEDLLDLYEILLDPDEPVVCLDEKPIQLLGESRSPLAMERGKPLRRDAEYVRKGVANVFRAVEPKAGLHMPKATLRRCGVDFAKMLRDIADRYSTARTIDLVVDNLSTHKEKSLIDEFGPERGARLWARFYLHYTPKHTSWLNQAEIAISMFSRSCLGKQRIPTFSELAAKTKAWEKRARREKPKIECKFTSGDARKKFKYDRSRGWFKLAEH